MLLDMLIKQAKHSNLSLKAKGSNISTCGDNISDFIPNSGSEEPAQDNQGTVNEKIEGLLPDNSQRNKEILGNFQKLLLEVFDNYQGALEGQEENPLLQLKKLMLTTDEPTSSTLTPGDNSKENTAIIDGKPGTGLQPASESAAVSEKASGSNGKQSNSTPAAGMQASRSVKGDAANPKTGPEQAPPTLKEEAAAPKITAEQNLHSMKGNTAYNKAVPAPTTVSPNNEAAGLRTDSTAGNNTPGSTQAGRGVVPGGEKQVVSSNQTAQPAGNSAAVSDKPSGNGKQSNSTPAANDIKTGMHSPHTLKVDTAAPKIAAAPVTGPSNNEVAGQKMGFPANNAAPGAGQTDTEKQATFDLEISRKVNPVAAKQYNEGNLPGQKEANFTPSRGQSGPDRILGSSGTDQQARSLQGSNPPKNQEQPNLIKNETSINPLQAHIVKSDAASTVNTGQNITQSAQMAARLASAIQQTVINKDGTASLRIKLKPEHLGEVTIRLVYNQGNLQAHFMATHMHTRDMLEHSMGLLKENLSQMNINLTDASTSSSDDGGKPGENQPGEKHWYKPKKEEESFSFHESTEDMPEAESSPGVKTGVLNKLI